MLLALVGALVALAGCRSNPTVAAYVGSTHYSQDRVTAIADEADAKLRALAERAGAARPARPVTEQQVVTALVSRDVLKALAQEKNINPVDVDANQIAQQVQVPPDAEYVQVRAEADGYRLGLLQKWPTAETTADADLREVYDNLVSASGPERVGPFDQFRTNIADQNVELVGRVASLRKDIVTEARKLDVTVNPRFGPTVFSLVDTTDGSSGMVIALLTVSLDATESGVKDLS